MEVNMAYFCAGLLIKVNVIFQLEHFPSRDDNHITWYDAWLDQQQEIINSNHKVIDWTPPTYFFFQVYQRQTLSEETSSLRRWLSLETLASGTLYLGQFTLSTQI